MGLQGAKYHVVDGTGDKTHRRTRYGGCTQILELHAG